MTIVREAMAGSLESSDILVRVSPGKGNLDVTCTSIVAAQFGNAIRTEIQNTLKKMGITNAVVAAEDKGALDCVIRARVEAAVLRASDTPLEWSVLK